MRAAEDEPGDGLAARIDAALGSYADPDYEIAPRLIAARALAAAGERQNARRWWALAGLASLLACLLVVALISLRRHHVGEGGVARTVVSGRVVACVQPHELHPLPDAALRPALPTALSPRANVPVIRRPNRSAPPRLDQFPTPQPLTEEEKVMLAFVSTASHATQQMVAHAVAPPPFFRGTTAPDAQNDSSLPDTQTTGVSHEKPR